jgi:hypothetical protein
MSSCTANRATGRIWLCAVGLAAAFGLAGCADAPPSAPSPSAAAASPATPVPTANSFAYPSTSSLMFPSKYGYHSGPYDNTGNGPGETGLEGGGG